MIGNSWCIPWCRLRVKKINLKLTGHEALKTRLTFSFKWWYFNNFLLSSINISDPWSKPFLINHNYFINYLVLFFDFSFVFSHLLDLLCSHFHVLSLTKFDLLNLAISLHLRLPITYSNQWHSSSCSSLAVIYGICCPGLTKSCLLTHHGFLSLLATHFKAS